MRRCVCVLVLFLLTPFLAFAALDVKPRAPVALLMNAETGVVLYEKNSRELCYPASITKIATALYAAKLQEDWQEEIVVPSDAIGSISSSAKKRSNYKKPAHWIEVGSTHIGLKKGEKMTFCDLMGAMMVASANDAANVIAYHVGGGDIDKFMEGLNSYLKEIGCKDTQFCNPHGLFLPKHQTTAADMAVIAKAFLKEAKLRDLAGSSSYTIEATNKQERRILPNSNKLVRKGASHHYPKAIGLKTGYTSDAGHTLVAAARHDDRLLIAVLMQCEERQDLFEDAKELFEKAFAEKKVKSTVLKKGKKAVKKKSATKSEIVQVELQEEVAISYYPAERPALFEKIFWKDPQSSLKEDFAGEIVLLTREGQLLGRSKIAISDKSQGIGARWYYGALSLRTLLLGGGALVLFLVSAWYWMVFLRKRSL